MGKGKIFEDIVAIALLYLNRADPHMKALSYEKAEMFESAVMENLNEMNIKIPYWSFHRNNLQPSELYHFCDEEGKCYVMINPNVDIQSAWSAYVGCLPIDILLALHQANVLKIIGLKIENGKFKKIGVNG